MLKNKTRKKVGELKEPINIVLDTQVFEGQNFNFNSRVFQSLSWVSNHDLAKVFITKINYSEVKNRVIKRYEEAIGTLKRNRKELRILNNDIGYLDLVKGKNKLNEKIIDEFEKFIVESRIQIIENYGISVEPIFDAYFKSLPPFNRIEKKAEFPDGVSMLMAYRHFNERNENAIIISKDKDLMELIESLHLECLHYHDDIARVLESFYPAIEIAKFKEYLEQNKAVIIKSIRDNFKEKEIEFSYLEEVEIKNREIQGIRIIDNSVIEEKNGIYYVIMKVELEFELFISCNDPNGYFYDSEDKEYIYVGETIEREINRSIEQEIEIECEPKDDSENEWSFYVMEYPLVLDEEYDY
jgi:hypothetical protein